MARVESPHHGAVHRSDRIAREPIKQVARGALPLGAGRSVVDRRLRHAVLTHQDRLLRVLRKSGVGDADARDIAQEAYWLLARRLGDVPEQAERAFLIGAALRMASDRRRSGWCRLVTERCDGDDSPGALTWAADAALTPSTIRRLVDVGLDALPERERSVLLLGDLEELSRSEIARVLDLPEGTVATCHARARKAFRRAVLHASCSPPSDKPAAPGLDAWGTRTEGVTRYENNTYGADRALGRFEQRLLQRPGEKRREHGWTWRWPGLVDVPVAYPEVVLGWKPWRGGRPTDARFPVRVGALRQLALDYAVQTTAYGRYNLALDLWITASGKWSLAADPAAIVAEVMVHVDSQGIVPLGSFSGEIAVDGERYELWVARNVGANSRAGSGWPTFTFRRSNGATTSSVDVAPLLLELRRRGLACPEHWVASLELGNEIAGGVGTTWVERFDVELRV